MSKTKTKQNKTTPRHLIFKLQKFKDKEKLLTEVEEIHTLSIGKQRQELHLTSHTPTHTQTPMCIYTYIYYCSFFLHSNAASIIFCFKT